MKAMGKHLPPAASIGAEKLVKKPEDVVQPECEGDNEDTVS